MSKILAIDYGEKNIGLALSDDEQKFAFAYNTLQVDKRRQTTNKTAKIMVDLKKICQLEKVIRIVVGLPIGLNGNNTKKTEEVFAFVKELEEELNLPVETEDERYTTVAAARLPQKNARNIDELSAQILLAGYLERINSF